MNMFTVCLHSKHLLLATRPALWPIHAFQRKPRDSHTFPKEEENNSQAITIATLSQYVHLMTLRLLLVAYLQPMTSTSLRPASGRAGAVCAATYKVLKGQTY